MLEPFVYRQANVRILFGLGALEKQIVGELDALGARRVVVIATPSAGSAKQRLLDRVGDRCVAVIDGARRHVPVEVVQPACSAARRGSADLLVAFGGGSVIGLAKAIARETELPIVAIPTTCSGSEMTSIFGLTEGGHKRTGRDDVVRPRAVLYDPLAGLGVPGRVMALSAVNAVAHCVDAIWGPNRNPICSLLAVDGVRSLRMGLEQLAADPAAHPARGDLLYGGALAGMALDRAGSALHHRICHVLGGAFDLPHAETHAVILPHSAAYNADASPAEQQRIAAVFGADSLPSALLELGRRWGAPRSLADMGVKGNELPAIAAGIAAAPPANPVPVTEAGVLGVLTDAFEGNEPAPNRGGI